MRNVRSAATVAALSLVAALAFVAFPFGSRSAAQDATLRKEKVSVVFGTAPGESIEGVYLASEGAGFWLDAEEHRIASGKGPFKHKLFVPWTSVKFLMKVEKEKEKEK